MSRLAVFLFMVIAAGTVAALATSGSASAHERRTVGKYQLVVGFSTEPAYVNEPNGLSLAVSVPKEGQQTGDPVTGLDQTLKAEVIVGGGAKKMNLTLAPRFNAPGSYDARFIPTLAGDYTYRIFGTINGDPIDESFSSSPRTFNSVQDVTELQFPDKVPGNSQLASLITANNNSGDSSSDTATILAIVGIIVGLAGLTAGGLALATRRRA